MTRDAAWPLFFGGTIAAWAVLFAMSGAINAGVDAAFGEAMGPAPALGALSPGFDAAAWRALCLAAPTGAPFWALWAMWAVMGAAMMAPTATPTLAAYRELTAGKPQAAQGFWGFAAGYLTVWSGFALVAAALQTGLAAATLVSSHGLSVSDELTAALLLGAGLYQFSALKAACLAKCRAPIAFFLSHWRSGGWGGFQMGLRHGAICVGCCWALMLLAFVGGAMNLAWMGGAMVLMTLEKLPRWGAPAAPAIGFALIALGAAVLVRVFV